MGKTFHSFLSTPAMDEPVHTDQAKLFNTILICMIGCLVIALMITLIQGVFRSTLLLLLPFLLLIGIKILLNAKKYLLAVYGFFIIISAMSLFCSTLLPDWSILAISLLFIGILASLLLNIRVTLIIFAANAASHLALSLPYWTENNHGLAPFLWTSFSVLLIIVMINYFLNLAQTRQMNLLARNEQFETENCRLKEELEQAQNQVVKNIEATKLLELKIKDTLNVDTSHRYNPQTGILLEEAVKNIISNELSRTQRYQHPLALLCMRVDHFYTLIQQSGLTPGNLLSVLADALSNSLRREDLIGHFGDDGFLVILPETGRYASYVVAERLRHFVEMMSLFDITDAVPLTISIGLTSYQDQSKLTAEAFTKQASDALGEAELHGGNWTINWHDMSHTV
ncbi:MAG: GGDEF domain-containing protein [Anaerolineaceae bacterium]|nr:GGDEF domain-containing protein [Anaerolineaceae bacterium]